MDVKLKVRRDGERVAIVDAVSRPDHWFLVEAPEGVRIEVGDEAGYRIAVEEWWYRVEEVWPPEDEEAQTWQIRLSSNPSRG